MASSFPKDRKLECDGTAKAEVSTATRLTCAPADRTKLNQSAEENRCSIPALTRAAEFVEIGSRDCEGRALCPLLRRGPASIER
jgi:hypothetical protein